MRFGMEGVNLSPPTNFVLGNASVETELLVVGFQFC